MALSNLTSAHLQKFVHLVKEREELQGRISAINAELSALETGKTVSSIGRKELRPKKRSKGKKASPLKGAILAALREAGAKGMSIPDLATAISGNKGSVSVWLYTHKKQVKKVSPGTFALAR